MEHITLEDSIKAHTPGNKVYITKQAIEKVELIHVSGLTIEQNLFLRECHRNLLKYAMEYNDSNEVATIIKLPTLEIFSYVCGTKDQVEIEYEPSIYHELLSGESKSLIVIHNHPRLSDFSAKDLTFFMVYSQIKCITIVTNLGHVKFLNKTERFSSSDAINLINEFSIRYGIEKRIEKFLRRAYTVGIERRG